MATDETNRPTVTQDRPRPTPYPSEPRQANDWLAGTDPATAPERIAAPAPAGERSGWLSFDDVAAPAGPGTSVPRNRKSITAAVALLLVGALCGALITLALKGSSTNSTASGQGFGGPGGEAAGQFPGGATTTAGVSGTISAVSTTSISIKGSTGTVTTYVISSATQVVQGTTTLAVSALKAGEQATVTPAAATTAGAATTGQTAATITVGASTGATGTTGTSGSSGTAPTGTEGGTAGQPPTGTNGQPPAGAPGGTTGMAPAA